MDFGVLFIVAVVCFLAVAAATPLVSFVLLRKDYARLAQFSRPARVGRVFAVELLTWFAAVCVAASAHADSGVASRDGALARGLERPRPRAGQVSLPPLVFVLLVVALLAFFGFSLHEHTAGNAPRRATLKTCSR